ncbi:zinc-ribbon domain-containing protein [Flavisolibacter tropicus]|uniref:Zinc-ribbon 15 domain-containing protein n=1 Tax=Flavisolibacter tropicus TaxID=1492898 RepID=A0A172TYL2_9BACT|nr:zinc-ribbon domain-containing protein [Flavisolibacter tropicus]ANE52165.1 hypothetical protein SY85_18365 [Flavisolibacter tropicus]
MFIIYGWRKKMVGAFDAFLYKCPYCEQTNTTTIAVYSKYYHIFWLPLFPYAKEAHAGCSSCNAARDDNKFGPELTKQAKEIQKEVKHPVYLYLLTILFCLVVAAVTVASILR